jgi:hypothetical protein
MERAAHVYWKRIIRSVHRGGDMSDEKPPDTPDAEEDVEAQLLKESLGAGLAAAAIFAGASQAAPYPVPSPPGTASAAAELGLIPKKEPPTRTTQQANAKAQTSVAAKKTKKLKKSAIRRTGGGRAQPH